MDALSNLKYAKGSVKRNSKRFGRGEGSGRGSTSGRGMNGQNSRSGAEYRAWFEGGQMPLQRRVPKKGFNNFSRVEYQAVNVKTLQKLSDEKKLEEGKIDPVILYKNGLIGKANEPFKILGEGELKAKLEVEAHKFSGSAKKKIEQSGGTIKKIED